MNRRGFLGLVAGALLTPKETLRKALIPVAKTRIAPSWLREFAAGPVAIDTTIAELAGRRVAMMIECRVIYGDNWEGEYRKCLAKAGYRVC